MLVSQLPGEGRVTPCSYAAPCARQNMQRQYHYTDTHSLSDFTVQIVAYRVSDEHRLVAIEKYCIYLYTSGLVGSW
jgi:hypothetical protein